MKAAQLGVDAVGVLAGLCSLASFVPQIGKIIRTRAAESVSLRMLMATVAAFTLWTIYGLLLQSWPVVLSNSVCLLLALAIVGLRLRFGDGR